MENAKNQIPISEISQVEDHLRITDEEFGCLLDRILSNGYRLEDWYPTMENAEELTANMRENYQFIVWILESNDEMELNEEQVKVEQFLQEKLKNFITFVENPEDSELFVPENE